MKLLSKTQVIPTDTEILPRLSFDVSVVAFFLL